MAGPDIGREYPPETVWQAQELYCVLRFSYAKVAAELDVAESTLKRWGQQYGWAGKREMIAQAQADIRADTILARSQMLKQVLATSNPLAAFAVEKLERLAMEQAEAEREGRAAQAREEQAGRRRINGPADAAAALREAIEIKLSRILASPADVDLKAVKDLKAALDAVAEFDAQSQDKKAKGGKGLSAEQAELIRKRILGGE